MALDDIGADGLGEFEGRYGSKRLRRDDLGYMVEWCLVGIVVKEFVGLARKEM